MKPLAGLPAHLCISARMGVWSGVLFGQPLALSPWFGASSHMPAAPFFCLVCGFRFRSAYLRRALPAGDTLCLGPVVVCCWPLSRGIKTGSVAKHETSRERMHAAATLVQYRPRALPAPGC